MVTFEEVVARIENALPASVRNASWYRPRYPTIGVDIREDAVVAVHLTRSKGAYRLAGFGRVPLPEGTFSVSLAETAIGDGGRLVAAVGEALAKADCGKAQRISVSIPDTAARVVRLELAELPSSPVQARDVVRWRVKKSVPFSPQDAALSYQVLGTTESGKIAVLAAIAPHGALRPLEELLEGAGYRVGLIDLASFDVYNALRLGGVLAGSDPRVVPLDTTSVPARDRAILSATPTYFSVMILRDEQVVFYRSKNYHVRGGYQGEHSLRVVGRELRTTLSYYEEHLLGEGLELTLVRAAGIRPEGLVAAAEEAGCGRVEVARLGTFVGGTDALDDDDVTEILPALGLALRREA